ncbi:MAG TPA: thiamine pyrophosphate-dependent enzyme [Solirubrobacteraceae bacterium]
MSSTAGRATVAETIAEIVVERAADRAFVFPGGGSNLELIDALERCGVGVVLSRSEGAAALMAASYADLVGRPALLLVGLGPGTTSVVNGLAHALLDQSAVVMIGDRFTDAEAARTGHQVVNQIALLSTVTKWQATLSPEGAANAVRRAFSVAASTPRGPVHLELDHSVALAPAAPAELADAPDVSEGRLGESGSGPPPARDHSTLAAAASVVTAARRPVVLVGDEVLDARRRPLIALLERLGAPVLCSYKGKGAVPEEHPLWCGIVTNAALEASLLEAADAILAIGLDPVELLSRPWPASAPVVALREHAEASPGYEPEHVLVGDLADLVDALHTSLGQPASDWSAAEIAETRAGMLAALRIPSPDSLTALAVVEEVQAQAPPTTTVTVDAGAHMLAVTWGWRSSLPRRFLISNGLATMGFALPAAVAAALARPTEPVIAFTGDGGLLLHGGELETAARIGARLLVMVLNDSSLSLIRVKQEERGYRRTGVDFRAVDAAGFGRSLGAVGFTARTAEELRTAIGAALTQSRPAVLDVRISGSEYGELQRVIRGTGARSQTLSGASVCLR